MSLKHIRIKNYRSIKEIDISANDIVALVGPNDSGKTNILSAINFVLGERFPARQSLEGSDFFQKDPNQELKIEIWVSDNTDNIEKIWATCSPDGFQARYGNRNGSSYYLSNAVREKFAVTYLDAARSFDSHFSTSRWSLFGRIVRQLHDDFIRTTPLQTQQAVREHLGRAQELLKTPLYQHFETAIAEAFQDQVRRTTHQVAFDFRTFDPLNFYKSLYPILIDRDENKNPNEAGSGMRSLIVMALFRAYARAFKGNAVIAFEEPEMYLHPHAQRSLATLFEELAANGAQIFYSTHSTTFIDISRSDRIVLVERHPDEDGDICTQVRATTRKDLLAARRRTPPGHGYDR